MFFFSIYFKQHITIMELQLVEKKNDTYKYIFRDRSVPNMTCSPIFYISYYEDSGPSYFSVWFVI
jgi:hypothetical protein